VSDAGWRYESFGLSNGGKGNIYSGTQGLSKLPKGRKRGLKGAGMIPEARVEKETTGLRRWSDNGLGETVIKVFSKALEKVC